jgi:hypothetical protein
LSVQVPLVEAVVVSGPL